METHRRRLAGVTAGAAFMCAIVGGGFASAQSDRSAGATTFHAPVGFDRASGIRSSTLRQKAPADVMVLPAAQVAAIDEFTESFDDITRLPGAGWALTNNSAPVGPSSWFQGNQTIFPAHEGAPNGYIAANYESAGDAGTLSNWLITPEVAIVNGTELRFWTRTTVPFENFFDRLEVRLSVAGASADVGATADSVGDFSERLLTINENLEPGVYPEEWTEYVVRVQGRSRAPVTGRFAFRYWVTDTASNGDYIGIDTVTVTQPGDGGTACANPVEDIDEGFDDIAQLPGACWALINNSEPLGTRSWHQGFVFPAHEGAPEAYIANGAASTAGEPGTINDWLLTPEVSLENGTELRFWTRANAGDLPPDRLEVRMSTAGASTNVGDTANSVGDFTALLLSVNPDLERRGYPEGWTEFVVTVSGVDAPASGRLAFRYFVTDAGPSGVNSWGIGIDTVTVTPPGGGGGSGTITHSASMEIQQDRGPACVLDFDEDTQATQYLRTFALTDFGVTGTFNVTEVTFGVEFASRPANLMTVNLYTLDGDFTYDNLTLIGSAPVTVDFGFNQLVTVPVTGEAPAGSTLVVEIAAPHVTVGYLLPGANDLGETAPSYIAADACGIPNPITFADYGFPNSHLVMTVTGETGDGAASSARPSQTSVDLTSGSVPGRWRAETVRIGSGPMPERSRWFARVR
ncbi:MAG: choice-of-anchor J domain-containing protein [Vicinamibacteraceae bacterium]